MSFSLQTSIVHENVRTPDDAKINADMDRLL